jgi:hypothetical protein
MTRKRTKIIPNPKHRPVDYRAIVRGIDTFIALVNEDMRKSRSTVRVVFGGTVHVHERLPARRRRAA